MSYSDLPTLNVALNFITASALLAGFVQIKRKNKALHKKIMLFALICSGLFLTSYITYHLEVGSVPYPFHDWTRPLYFAILIPHVILAIVVAPFVVVLVVRAFKDDFERHKRLARIVWPVWMFVSISGIAVYSMLYLR
ncbi:MAG: DUF420 domain-containing protein [candidate division Zixibacteria bacterium]|nr:DUF420 domain-containing protein [candidate division Zixibacteria bacterium]